MAKRAVLLYFCAADFAVVDPMYQLSLKWFVEIFKTNLTAADHFPDQNQLVQSFQNSFALSFYESVSFSLFSRHKLLFSFLITARIQISEQKLPSNQLAFFLSPSQDTVPALENSHHWLSEESWNLSILLPTISTSFANLTQYLANQAAVKLVSYFENGEEMPAHFVIPPVSADPKKTYVQNTAKKLFKQTTNQD